MGYALFLGVEGRGKKCKMLATHLPEDPRLSGCVPLVVTECIKYFEEHNVYNEEGLFRISASVAVIDKLQAEFAQAALTGVKPDLSIRDPHEVAGIFKQYFRNLQVPLLTYELYECFLVGGEVSSDDAGVKSIKSALMLLPLPNLLVIKLLVGLLRKVSLHSQINKMNATNLAIVFSPSLLRPRE